MIFGSRCIQIVLFCVLASPLEASALYQVRFHSFDFKSEPHQDSEVFSSLDHLKRQLVLSLPGQAGWRAQALLLRELIVTPLKIFGQIDPNKRQMHLKVELDASYQVHVEELPQTEKNILELINKIEDIGVSPSVLEKLYLFFYADDYERFENFLGVTLLQMQHGPDASFFLESVLEYRRIRNSWVESISSKKLR